MKIREGVAEERPVSVEDPEMRHGRKSKTKRSNGSKRHIATDLDSGLILSGAITPANRPEEEAAPGLAEDMARQGFTINETLHRPRLREGNSRRRDPRARRRDRLSPLDRTRQGRLHGRAAFEINMRDFTITCPAGETERIDFGSVTEFDPEVCATAALCARSAPRLRRDQGVP